MEFLVRLIDKTSTMVLCLNPVHKGNHMDRVVFDDPTFAAKCPECGSTEYLYRKNNAMSKKGHFITFQVDGWTWGTNERKHYGIARIACTYEQAQDWCQTISDESNIARRFRKYFFDYEVVLKSNELAKWNNMNMDSDIITISEINKAQIKEIAWP